MTELSPEAFEEIVYQKLDLLPIAIKQRMENVAIIVEGEPSGPHFGLYHGVPFPRRKSGSYSLILPDRIILYRGPICRESRDRTALENLIRRVLFHEIGHYLGLGERDLADLGL